MHREPSTENDETLPGTGGTSAGSGDDGTTSRREIGSVVAEDYRIEGLLGAGGMGVVYLARHTNLDRQVAVKELMSSDPEGVERLRREAMAMARLDHPNVVRVFDARQLGDRLFIAMEHLAGGTLRQWCEQPRSHLEILNVFGQAARGLSAAHAEGIVHRDFKPDNVLLTQDGRAKVGDFGIARGWTEAETSRPPDEAALTDVSANLTRTGALMGTPAYMAPEQYDRQADPRSDQFAFCVALYEALYGQRPFEGRTPAELWVHSSEGNIRPVPESSVVPRRVFDVLRQGLDADPGRRFSDVGQLMRALRRASSSRLTLVASLGVAVVLAVIVVGTLGWVFFGRDVEGEAPTTSAASRGEAEPAALDDVVPPLEPDLPVAVDELPRRADVPRPDDGIERRAMPAPPPEGYNPPGNRTFDGKLPFICRNEHAWFVGAKLDSAVADPIIVAGDGCDFRCSRCSLRGASILSASGNASVQFTSSRLFAREYAISAGGNALVRLTAVSVEMEGDGTAVSMADDARVSLYEMDVEGEVPIVASGNSNLLLQNVSVIGEDAAVRASADVTVRDEGGVLYFVGGEPAAPP